MSYTTTSAPIINNSISVNNTGTNVQGNLITSGSISCTSLTVNGRSSAYTQYCAGRVGWNGSSVVKDFVASSSQYDFTVSRSGVGTYTVTYSSGAHPSGSVNYVVSVTGYSCVAILRSTSPPTATTFTVALYLNTGSWGTSVNGAFYFSVLY